MPPKQLPRKDDTPTTPTRFAETLPQQPSDFSYLEMVMELTKSMMTLTERVSALTEASKSHDAKLDKISHEIFAAKAVLYVCGGLIAVIGSSGVFVVNKAWDAFMAYAASGHK